MRVLVLADFHIWNHAQLGGPMEGGLNRRCRDLLRDIRDTVEGAKRNYGIEAVVQLGDFFDKSNPPPAVLNAAMGMLKESGVQWHILAGNHDIRSFGAPSAVTPLGKLDGVFVYDEPARRRLGGVPWAMVPFTSRTALESVRWARGTADIACFHYGLVARKQPDRPDTVSTQELSESSSVGPLWWGYFGHEHGSRTLSNRYASLGSFSQHNFGDPLVPYIGAIVDTREIPCSNAYKAPLGVSKLTNLVGPRFADMRAIDFSVCSLQSAFHQAFVSNPTNLYCIFKPEDAKLAERLVEVGVVTDYRLAPLELKDSTPVSDPFVVESITTGVDMDACVLEELQAKLSDEEIPKAWEIYESILRA